MCGGELNQGKRHYVLGGNRNIGVSCLSNARPASHSVNRNKSLLEKVTVGLRQRSATPSRDLSMSKKENDKKHVSSDEVTASSVNSFEEDNVIDMEADNDKEKETEIKSRPNVFRRVAARFRRWRKTRTSPDDNIIHVQPAKVNTYINYMPP